MKALQERCLTENLPCMVAESHQIQGVMELVKQVAQSPDAPVLILGETGTGKELIAAAVHYQSPLHRGPLVALNCAALPKELIESELFGYEPGAFSGARAGGKKGLVEQAAGGTLFLDEVGDLPPRPRPSCCASWTPASTTRSEPPAPARPRCGWWRPPTRIWKPWWPKAASAATFTSAWGWSRWRCLP